MTRLKSFLSVLLLILFFALPIQAATTWRVDNSAVLGGEVCSQWQTGHAYTLGARCVPRIAYGDTAARAFVYEVTTAGTSHAATEPTWPKVAGNTVVDNEVTWTCRSPGDGTWDNASCILLYITNYAYAAGDTIYIDDGHSENTSYGNPYSITGITYSSGMLKIYCVDKATDLLSTGAIVQVAGQSMVFTGCGFSYGVCYGGGTTETMSVISSHGVWIFEGNNSNVIDIRSGYYFQVGNGSEGTVTTAKIINGNINMGGVSSTIYCYRQGKFDWRGGAVKASTGVTAVFKPNQSDSGHFLVEDVDMDEVGSGATATSIYGHNQQNIEKALFTRLKLPSDAGFTLTSGTVGYPWMRGKVRFHHCSAADKTYDFFEECYEGTIQDETTIVRTGGASDGTTPQSWKMISSAYVTDNIIGLESPPIVGWTESTTEKTFTVECILDSATNLQNDEVWMELEYPANGTDGLGTIARDKCAQLGTPADRSVSTETWGDGAMANPNKFKCSVTVTPGKAGPITAKIYLAKASTTIYVDPKITEE